MHWVPSIGFSFKTQWSIRWSWEVPFTSLCFVFQHCVQKSRQHTLTLRSTMRPRIYLADPILVWYTLSGGLRNYVDAFCAKWKQLLVRLKQRRFIRSYALIDAYRHTRIASTAIQMRLPNFPWNRVNTKYSWKKSWKKLQCGSTQQILDPTGEFSKKKR